MELTREVRFSLGENPAEAPITNSWGGWPSCAGLAPYLVLRVTVAGEVDPVTGYLCNIALLDRAVRGHVIPHLRARWEGSDARALAVETLVLETRDILRGTLPAGVELRNVELRPTPHLAYQCHVEKPAMVSITQTFEFAAAHRLHCPQLSEAENRATFGKCTNPNGHGHNYLLEVTIEGEPDAVSGVLLPVGVFEAAVKSRVIDVFDHKHLNEDCPEFAALNPSVENITRVIWEKLDGAFEGAGPARVRVYETPKTAATYTGL